MEKIDEELMGHCVAVMVVAMVSFILLHHFLPVVAVVELILIPALFIIFYDYPPKNKKK